MSPLAANVRLEMMQRVPASNEAREAEVYRLLREVGCDELNTQPVSTRDGANLICSIKGERGHQAAKVIIGAHHDTYRGSPGYADNWSGITLLVSLAEQFSLHRPQHTLVFVSFAGEEQNLQGSRRYVRLAETLPDMLVNLDTLALAPMQYDPRSDRQLQCLAKGVGMTRSARLRNVTSDWQPFAASGVPVLALHSLHQRNLPYLHSTRDTRGLVDDELLQASFQSAFTLLRLIDDTLTRETNGSR